LFKISEAVLLSKALYFKTNTYIKIDFPFYKAIYKTDKVLSLQKLIIIFKNTLSTGFKFLNITITCVFISLFSKLLFVHLCGWLFSIVALVTKLQSCL